MSRGMSETERRVYRYFRERGSNPSEALQEVSVRRPPVPTDLDAYAYAINESMKEAFGDD